MMIAYRPAQVCRSVICLHFCQLFVYNFSKKYQKRNWNCILSTIVRSSLTIRRFMPMEPETRYFCYRLYRQKLLFVEHQRLSQWQPKICPSQPHRKQPTNCFLFGMVTQWKVPDSRFVYTSCFLSRQSQSIFRTTVTDSLVDTKGVFYRGAHYVTDFDGWFSKA